ncbi:MAG TPA: ATP-dependent DNA helicase [Candidatus Nanopelagicales bacterium]
MRKTDGDGPALTLDRTARPSVRPPQLDDDQLRVVAHRRGPLLVLAGPGTGKTTTLVEAMVARLRGPDALRPDQVLGLTFGRRAAQQWREQVVARLGGGLTPTVTTFHSFSYALVRQQADSEQFAAPPRLLSGPEQELRLRELLLGSVRDGRLAWPAQLQPALGTRGLAAEVRAFVARARSVGLDPLDLELIGAGAGELGPAWSSLGGFLGEYLDVLDAEGVSDYAEIVHRAGLLAHDPEVQRELRATYRVVLVDEFQDTDPSQVRLLQGLVGPGTTFVAVGDPDQSIYGFRGAERQGILRFPDTFAGTTGEPAPVVVLGRTRRFGPLLRDAAARVLRTTSLAPLPASVQRRHRNPTSDPAIPGTLDVVTFDSESAESAHVANLMRRAHLEDGVAWHDMAVVVRSGRRSVPPMRRALAAAGVPVEVAADELPLAAEPAIAPLLQVLRVATGPELLDAATVHDLLVSPLADADPGDLRHLGRALRAAQRAGGTADGSDAGHLHMDSRPAPSQQLVRDLVHALVADPGALSPVEEAGPGRRRIARAMAALRRVAATIRAASDVVAAQGSAEDALWAVWSSTSSRLVGGHRGTGWPERLERAALRGGDGGRRADADLDAVVALFAAAARVEERYGGHRGVLNFLDELEAAQIPADTLAERAVRGPAVRLLTAHRAKGLQWRLVVVSGVQEGVWPDVRRRGSLLAPDRLEATGLVDAAPMSELLGEERRLFYVACTRARERLVVTAVRSAADDGLQPSRFLDDVAGPEVPVRHVAGRPARPLSVSGLVANLRSAAVDAQVSPALRAAAARRLAVLAGARDATGRALVPAADPVSWWGIRETTSAPAPVRPVDTALKLSGSQVSAVRTCPLRWFLDHEIRATVTRSTALGFGSLVHALADAVARDVLPADLATLDAALDSVWGELGFEAAWQSTAERAEASRALARFLIWHQGRPDRTLVASELRFDVTVPGGEHGVRLTGSFDRVELDADGAVHVADLKTQKSPPSKAELVQHPQLGVYQLAVAHGALDPGDARSGSPEGGTAPVVAGAELVQLRGEERDGRPKVQSQPALEQSEDGGNWVLSELAAVEEMVRAERFHPLPGTWCRTCAFRSVCPADLEGAGVLP